MNKEAQEQEVRMFEEAAIRERNFDLRRDERGIYINDDTYLAFRFFRIGLWSPKLPPPKAESGRAEEH